MRGEKKFKTTCSYCGVGCGIEVSKKDNGKITLQGDESHPVNKGMLCSKGRNLHYTAMDQTDRLTSPQLRWSKNHPLEEVSWDTAIERGATVFKTLIDKFGPDSVGLYVSGQCLTEEYYLANKLVKGFFGTNNIDTNSRLCMSSAVMGYKLSFGEDSVPVSYEDIELADCFLITGANPAWCHPILFRRLENHKAANPDTKIIVIDPRITDSASSADLHLQIQPGTDTAVLHAIGRILIEKGNIDEQFINDHTEGYQQYRKMVMSQTVKDAAATCRISVAEIEEAARLIGNAKGFISMWAMGLNQSTEGVNKNLNLLGLHLITGHIGKPGSGPFSLTGQPNAMGGREVGGMATLLAAHKNLNDPEHRQEVADFWGVESIRDKPGFTATEMFEALRDGRMKAIWIMCTNPSVSMPSAKLVDEALKKARFVIVQDISNRSDTLQYADLVLPAAAWLEKEGTMTNSERRISYLNKAIEPPGKAMADTEIILRFARKMGYDGFEFNSPSEVFEEYVRMTKGTNIDITGLDYDRLKANGTIQWPVPSKDHPGTPRLFTNGAFYTPNQKAKIHAGGPGVAPPPPSEDFPLILTTGRIRDQWHTMTKTGKVQKLNAHISAPFLEMHPKDAGERNLSDGDPVVVSNGENEVQVTVQVTALIKQGVVFLPMHWGKILNKDTARANNITSSAIDPVSKQPGFKFNTVQVTKYIGPKQKIVVVGAGAAAYRFLHTYRQYNQDDEITVFSKEKWPFYNRVLLPDYVNGHKPWQELEKFQLNELEQLDVHLQTSNAIVEVDRENKKVKDAKDQWHSYDTLILATGSRAFVPSGVPKDLPGVLSIRNREDAESLKSYLHEEGHVVIVGGGLLGLELAAALREIDIEVTIIQRGSRLMERQLDVMASSMLKEYMEDILEVKVFTDEEINRVEKIETGLKAILKNGKQFTCNAVVYAIGTQPNVELAKTSGLACGYGVKVDDYLQTSDPSIYALGEIAEHKSKLNGVTLAAEEQADHCAKHILGDVTRPYDGTVPMNILKFPSLDLCSIGLAQVPQDGKRYEEILFMDRTELYYKKCIIHQDKLVGAILLGDKSEFAEFKELIQNGTELSEKRAKLLRSGKPAEPMLGSLVCSCNNVGTGNLEKAILDGNDNLNDLCDATGAGLGCGSCKPALQRMLEEMTAVEV